MKFLSCLIQQIKFVHQNEIRRSKFISVYLVLSTDLSRTCCFEWLNGCTSNPLGYVQTNISAAWENTATPIHFNKTLVCRQYWKRQVRWHNLLYKDNLCVIIPNFLTKPGCIGCLVNSETTWSWHLKSSTKYSPSIFHPCLLIMWAKTAMEPLQLHFSRPRTSVLILT